MSSSAVKRRRRFGEETAHGRLGFALLRLIRLMREDCANEWADGKGGAKYKKDLTGQSVQKTDAAAEKISPPLFFTRRQLL